MYIVTADIVTLPNFVNWYKKIKFVVNNTIGNRRTMKRPWVFTA
jgi:hypothetical protein